MDSELEDGSNINNSIGDDENQVEINGEVNTPQENGKHEVIVADDSPLIIEEDGKSDNDEASDEDPISVNNSIKEGTNQIALRKELSSKDVHSSQPIQTDELNDGIKAGDANGEAKGNLGKDGKPIVQRRMSLRTRATPKKYADAEGSNDDDLKDILAAKDPLEIPLGKNSSTVLIRKSPSVAVTVQKTPLKSPVKMTKVTRPPPELIKAPILSKISISPATSVTVVPRSKENNSGNSGYVVVDTQTILKGKNPTQVSNVPASVTVSAVPIPPKPLPKSLPSVASTVNRKSTLSASIPNPSSLPDPFESLGLADDSFIVEAPSFVVPYLIEKSASQNLKKTVESMNPTSSSGNKEDVIVLSEDDSNDSGKKEKEKEEDKSNSYPQTTTTGNALDKSAVKTEVDRTTEKSNSSKEDDYFVGPIGRFFLDIGLSLVQEYVQGDLLRVQKRKVHKGTKITDPSLTINALTKGLDITRTKNDPYRLPLRSCDRCNFKSESFLTMSHHWSLPLPLGYGSISRHGCHWCSFEAKESHLVAAHIESEHGMKSRVGPDIPAHQCPLCPFEDNVKSKVTRHMMSCQKRFIAGRNLEPPLDWEPPAKIPRMPTRGPRAFPSGMNAPSGLHGYPFASTKGLGLPYHPLLPKSALLNTPGYNSVLPSTGAGQNAYLGSGSPAVHSKSSKVGTMPSQAALAGLRLPAELHVVPGGPQRSAGATGSSQSKTRDYHKQPSNQSSSYLNPSYAVPNNQIYQAIAKSFQLLHGQGSSMSVLPSNVSKNQSTSGNAIDKLKKPSNVNAVSLLPGLVNTSGLTIQSSTTPPVNKIKPNQQPSISITPLPRSSTSASANKPSLSVSPVTPTSTNAMSTIGNNTLAAKPGQPLAPGQKGAVVCEICDGSIKDLEQLRHHMQWIHKVKIHPKMIHNRPPLNCQKCQCRFFTDQGLERHLLGSHGLVTSSMQEAANRGQDGGRCPICGKVHQWKLLSHVVKDHGLSLKPAHLSYKCTVCTATFTMYKLFENHVYTAHSVVARKVLDKEKVENKKGSSSLTNTSTTGALRINDEITIIPQTTRHDSSDQNSCRPSRGDKRSRVDIIDLSDDEDNKDGLTLPKSQVTITKVPAPKGYFGKNSRESMSKRSRTDDNDTE